MIDWLLGQPLNGWFVIGFYWIPMLVCIIGYGHWVLRNITTDLRMRDQPGNYYPTVKLGDIVMRLLGTSLPLVNCLCCLHAMDEINEYILNYPLVPKKKGV
jgi:hypothetical protein